MNDVSGQDRQTEWQSRIEAYRASGLSGSRFCQANDLIYHQFVYWRRKLSGTEPIVRRSTPTIVGGFTQVMVEQSIGAELRIELPGGLSIHGIRHQNLDLVQALLERL
ncbi:MAG: IS66 family insertion sequence element accessory protein TnpA [Gammaproteobacteria bacterium]